MAGREWVFRRQSVVDSEDTDPREAGQTPAMAVMAFEVADGEAAAVEIDEARRHGRRAGGRIEPSANRTVSSIDLQVTGLDVLGRGQVLGGPLHAVAGPDHLRRDGVQWRRRLTSRRCGQLVDHRLDVRVHGDSFPVRSSRAPATAEALSRIGRGGLKPPRPFACRSVRPTRGGSCRCYSAASFGA